jgi:hypothetical protein
MSDEKKFDLVEKKSLKDVLEGRVTKWIDYSIDYVCDNAFDVVGDLAHQFIDSMLDRKSRRSSTYRRAQKQSSYGQINYRSYSDDRKRSRRAEPASDDCSYDGSYPVPHIDVSSVREAQDILDKLSFIMQETDEKRVSVADLMMARKMVAPYTAYRHGWTDLSGFDYKPIHFRDETVYRIITPPTKAF